MLAKLFIAWSYSECNLESKYEKQNSSHNPHNRCHIPKHDSQSVQKLGKTGICCPFLKAPCYNGTEETESSTLNIILQRYIGNLEIKAPHIQDFRTGRRGQLWAPAASNLRKTTSSTHPSDSGRFCTFACCTLSNVSSSEITVSNCFHNSNIINNKITHHRNQTNILSQHLQHSHYINCIY